jgi:hypothetical protein
MKAKIVQPVPPKEEVPVEVIATSIVQISDAMKAINNTRLTRKAVVALIHDHSKLPKKTIEIVLNNLSELEKTWLKPAATRRGA